MDELRGKDGKDGADGADGVDGQNGTSGTQGAAGQNGLQGVAGSAGEKGDKGETGATGEKGDTGAAGQNATISVTNSTQPCSTGLNITGNGTSNLGLQFTGSNVPAGGMTGQVLTKNSNNNCDFIWKDTHELRGTGMPESVVTANVGTYYTDTLATNGAVRWVKAIGTGNTGWKVVYGDTGWRDVPSLLSGTLTGSAKVRRINQTIYIYARINSWGGSWNGGGASLPAGMRPMVQHNDVAPGKFGSTKFTYVIQAGGNINVEAPRAEENAGNIVPTINFSSPVGDTTPWPTTLPGAPTN